MVLGVSTHVRVLYTRMRINTRTVLTHGNTSAASPPRRASFKRESNFSRRDASVDGAFLRAPLGVGFDSPPRHDGSQRGVLGA